MFSVFGVEFKSKSELCRVLGYSKPISPQVLQKVYGGTWENLIKIRLKLKDREDELVKQTLENVRDQYERQQAEKMLQTWGLYDKGQAQNLPQADSAKDALPTPAELTLKAALRLAIEVIEDHTLQTAAISCGTSYRPEQIRMALKVFAENFDLRAAVQELAGSAGD